MFALDFLIALLPTASLRFSSWLPTKSRGVSKDVRGNLAKSSLTFVVYEWQRGLLGVSDWPKPSRGLSPVLYSQYMSPLHSVAKDESQA